MASRKKKIGLRQLLNEKDVWSLLSSSETYQYYVNDCGTGNWTETRKIKRKLVLNYLNAKAMEEYYGGC